MDKRGLEEYTRAELLAEALGWIKTLTPEQLKEVMEEVVCRTQSM